PQDFWTANSLSERWIEAGVTLLDKREVKTCRVGNRLNVVSRGEIGIASRNGRKLPGQQTRDCRGKGKTGIQIGVIVAAAVPSIPTGINCELHEVCEPSDLLCPCRLTTRQSAKLIQVDWIGALRSQVSV